MSRRKLMPEDYTFGWFCPLEVEKIAALEMLDEEHEALPISSSDHNVYTLGNIGGHNIVIVGLPLTGNNQAATVVTQTRMTFPELKYGLLVGIGGGVPTKTDNGMVRLGDVVVSKPTDQHSGAVHYDRGKAETGHFKRTGSLAPPPMVLLGAAGDLAVRRARMRNDPIVENIRRIDTNIRGLQKYMYPGSAQDHLYRPDYIHLDPTLSCDDCGCDPTQRVQRGIDSKDDDQYVVVHRGTIASGELVIKNALFRDGLAKQHGILCFETEAAGALVDFPCIVIRGISDYCDSHKNNQWQGYAAAAAAAYARQLFFHIPVIKGNRYVSSAVEEGIHRINRRQDNKERLAIVDWLTPVDYAPQQSDFITKRQEGTGQWLLDSTEFQNWFCQSSKTLFCPGIPGAGKTMLTSIVVEHLATKFQNNAGVGIAYIYFNFQRQQEQNPNDLLASLLKQLVQQQPSVPESIKKLYEHHNGKRTKPSFRETSQALRSVIAGYSKIFILIDALDECQVSRGGRRTFLSEIFDLQAKTGVNIFATSRFTSEIEENFKGCLLLEIRASDKDMQRYLDGRMSELRPFVLRDSNLQKQIKTKIIQAAEGMFLLAQLYLESLVDKMTPNAIRLVIENLQREPKASDDDSKLKALHDAYGQARDRITQQKTGFKELAEKVLSWIICAMRPLTTSELQHALAVEMGASKLDEGNCPEIEDIISVCAGLVVVDKESNIIRLVHYTAQEYFEKTWQTWLPEAQANITRTCVTYLLFDAFKTGFCPTDESFEARLRSNVLYSYVSRFWGYHAMISIFFYNHAAQNWGWHTHASLKELEELVLGFLESEANVSASIQAESALRGPLYEGYSQTVPRQRTAVHLAAFFGLKEIVVALLKKGYNPDSEDSDGETPLSMAASMGHQSAVLMKHEAIVELLLAEGADPDHKRAIDCRTPLSLAAEEGNEAVVKLLLAEDRVDPNSEGFGDDSTFTPLWVAARNGHEAIVKLLLAKDGVDPNYKDEEGWGTPLSLAAEYGHEAVVKLLLAKDGVDLNPNDSIGATPLSHAARNGHKAIVQLLLAKGVDPDSKPTKSGETPLWYAANWGHKAVVKLLLETGRVNPDSRNLFPSWTPLSAAAKNGHKAVVRLLLKTGAVNPDSKDEYGKTPLSLAAEGGHEAIVKLLLDTRAVNPDSKDRDGKTPLSWAVENGHEAVVKLLQPPV